MRKYKGKGTKILILVIVCVLIGSFSIGFSAISHSLLIKPHASIKPETAVGSFNVKFSNTSSGVNRGSVIPTTTPAGLAATNAEITGDTTISNFSVELNNPGDVIKYEFYAINDGTAPAYLSNIVLGDKTCSPIYGSTYTDASTLCSYINLSLQVGNITTTTSASVTEHPLAAAASEKVTITISFKAGLSESQLTKLGDVIVEFGDVSLIYTQVGGSDSETDTAICSLDDLDGTIDEGDIVTCGTESFYVMDDDGTNTTMLSMYNLNVGNVFAYNSDDNQSLTSIKNPTGMQNTQMMGCNTGTWCADYDSQIGSTYYGVLSQSAATTAIAEYAIKLRTLLGITTESDLTTSMITGAQLRSFDCVDMDETSCNYSWLHSTSYWVDAAEECMEYTGYWTYEEDYAGSFNPDVEEGVSWGYGYEDAALLMGARPVITILSDYITVE